MRQKSASQSLLRRFNRAIERREADFGAISALSGTQTSFDGDANSFGRYDQPAAVFESRFRSEEGFQLPPAASEATRFTVHANTIAPSR